MALVWEYSKKSDWDDYLATTTKKALGAASLLSGAFLATALLAPAFIPFGFALAALSIKSVVLAVASILPLNSIISALLILNNRNIEGKLSRVEDYGIKILTGLTAVLGVSYAAGVAFLPATLSSYGIPALAGFSNLLKYGLAGLSAVAGISAAALPILLAKQDKPKADVATVAGNDDLIEDEQKSIALGN